jgi:hypothetical protein
LWKQTLAIEVKGVTGVLLQALLIQGMILLIFGRNNYTFSL